MTKILLKLELGDWDGGHNGQYPKIIEWNLEDSVRPIEESEGWGHGLGGGSSLLDIFMNSKQFYHLGEGDSTWAHKVILSATQNNLRVPEISRLLLSESKNNKVHVPTHLLNVLNRFGRYVNA